MDKDEFYIGWQEEATSSYQQGRKKFFIVGLSLVLVFGFGYLFLENKFTKSRFDYGNLTEVEGTIVEYPVFGIRAQIGGKLITVPLVGFGKFDALPVLTEIKKRTKGVGLTSFNVKLRGTLIQYQDKHWMELTEGDQSIISIEESSNKKKQEIKELGLKKVSGEIVDPKCFFGVMNPAFGKIHRSCAIRCISGGIPPVLAIRENGIYVDYYFVLNQKGKPLNKEILQYVGMPVVLSGQAEQVNDWKTIKINSDQITQLISVKLDINTVLCSLN